ncbi:F-box/LRR-repeat protein-like [Dorcoceras hygrometricum]|uniref:F-box/LRR-repeat protein-like n=1 Tax=Dorcoceras hygrometricum TaxID=472368 RepID=A0A2Z7CPQ0_9LAMI|nr:F-box/LRR-repeat protein-like [Dorcoceras hygrometricum]
MEHAYYKRSRTKCTREDRLSNLPADILHHILSFLDASDVVRTCVLGKNWRNIWRSVPSLKFDFNLFLFREPYLQLNYDECLSKFWVFFLLTFFMREAPQVTKLHVLCHHFDVKQFQLLLGLLTKKNVKELHFEARFSEGDYPFSDALSEYLSSVRRHYDGSVKMQFSTAFENLKSIRLVTVYFNDAMITDKLFTSCGILENLSLEYCRMQTLEVLNISAPNLKKFTFLNICCNIFIPHLFHGRLNMHTPNLVNFCYNGPVISLEFSNVSSVNHVVIEVLCETYIVVRQPNLAAMVSALSCAKALSLPSIVPVYLSRGWYGSICHLPNTRSLRVGMVNAARYMEGLIKLLKRTPNLKILSMKFLWGFQDNWKSEDEDVGCLSHHVTEVQMTVSPYSVFPTEFVKFLLRNAKVLTKIQICLEARELDPRQFYALQTVNIASKTVALSVASISASGRRKCFSLNLANL